MLYADTSLTSIGLSWPWNDLEQDLGIDGPAHFLDRLLIAGEGPACTARRRDGMMSLAMMRPFDAGVSRSAPRPP